METKDQQPKQAKTMLNTINIRQNVYILWFKVSRDIYIGGLCYAHNNLYYMMTTMYNFIEYEQYIACKAAVR